MFRRSMADESGATLVELAIAFVMFIVISLAIVDFGILMASISMGEKATYLAARTAVVRPVACDGITFPERIERSQPPTDDRFGTNCNVASGPCAEVEYSCTGVAGQPVVDEIMQIADALIVTGVEADDFTFTYKSDPSIGYLGGPFTPLVTVELSMEDYNFISPLGALLRLAGSSGSLGDTFRMPEFSVTLPAEDLNQGEAG